MAPPPFMFRYDCKNSLANYTSPFMSRPIA